MLEQNKDKWGDKVKIVGLSIDKDAETVKTHISNKGWTSPIHYHRSKSDCSDVYEVRGVPHVLIIDTKGNIAFKGHPANRPDLVKDFNDLLEGKELSGLAPAEDKPEVDGEAAAQASVSTDTIQAAMNEADKFKETGKQLQIDCRKDATGMMRNFCVITVSASFNHKTNAWSCEYLNHRVLVGKEANVNAVKGKIEEVMGTDADKKGWTFEIKEQVHSQ